MNKIWKLVAGAVISVAGAAEAWQSYNAINTCNSLGGKISTFLSSIFGGSGAQTCYNAQILEIAGILVFAVGLVVIYFAYKSKSKK